MQMIEINKLIPHPRNKEFFDDMYGDRWNDFKESIGRRGIVEAIVTTQDLIIVSGHQRVRAAKEIGLLTVPVIVKHYDDMKDRNKEDMILEDLISTNIMQRGVGNINAIKMSRCIIELERIKGIRQGSAGKCTSDLDGNNFPPKTTQSNLANQLNMTEKQLRNYKKLNDLIPELQNLVSTRALSSTTAYKIWAKMPQDEQEKFFNDIGRDKIKTLTQKATKDIIDKANQEKEELRNENLNLQQKNDNLKNKLMQEQIKEPIVQVVDKTDYEKMEQMQKELEHNKELYELIKERENEYKKQIQIYEKDSSDYKNLKRQIELLTKEKDDIGRMIKSATDLSGYVCDIESFLKNKLAPVQYSRSIIDAKDNPTVIKNIIQIVECVEKWCLDIRKCLPEEQQNIINVNIEER